MKIKTAPGARVRHPDGRVLGSSAEIVEDNAYWRRRIAAGDVVTAPDDHPDPPKPKKGSKQPDETTSAPE